MTTRTNNKPNNDLERLEAVYIKLAKLASIDDDFLPFFERAQKELEEVKNNTDLKSLARAIAAGQAKGPVRGQMAMA